MDGLYHVLILTMMLVPQHSQAAVLPDRVFVISKNATGNLFSIASVPEVPQETYSFRETKEGLSIDGQTGMVRVDSDNWHNDEVNITLKFTVTIPASTDELDVKMHRLERGPYSNIFTNSPWPMLTGVPEWIRPDTPIFTVVAIDAADYGARVKYILESGGEGRFAVDPDTGEVKIVQRKPFAPSDSFSLALSAHVVGAAGSDSTLTQVLTVKGGNRPPQFSLPEYVISMDEFNATDTPTVNDPIARISVQSFYDLPIVLTLMMNPLADGTIPADKFVVQATGKEGSLTRGVLIPRPEVSAITVLSDPRQFRLTLRATEDVSGFTSEVQVIINVNDVNDHSPTFLPNVYTRYDVPETTAPGTFLFTVTAVDLDEGENARLTFEVDNENFKVDALDNNVANITTNKTLDYDTLPMGWYEFNVIATDHGSPARSGSAQLRVWVVNSNDESPVFLPPSQTAYVREKLPAGMLVHVVQAYDPDAPTFPYFNFSFQGAPTFDIFRIDDNSGKITLTETFPEKKTEKILLPVTLNDGVNPPNTRDVTVDIMGINRPPQIPGCTDLKPVLLEGQPVGTPVINITATDPDSGSNGELKFSLAGSSIQEKGFIIEQTASRDPYMALLKTTVVFNREVPVAGLTYYRIGDDIKYPVTVEVRDNSQDVDNTRSLVTTCFFLVTLGDINNNSPVFDNDDDFTYNPPLIPVSPPLNLPVFRAFASDRDQGINAEVKYAINNLNCEGCLHIDVKGYISVAKDLPTLGNLTYVNAEVKATDEGSPPTEPAYINITLRRDGAASPPAWMKVGDTDIDDYIMRLLEDVGPDFVVNPVFYVSTEGITETMNFAIPQGSFVENNNPTQFEISDVSNNSTRIRKISSKRSGGKDPLRYIKLRASYTRDANVRPYADKRLTIEFEDVNLNIPVFKGLNNFQQYSAHLSTESEAGYSVAYVFAIDEDSTPEYNAVHYSFTTDCSDCREFSIDAITGEVTNQRKFNGPNEPTSFSLDVYARDAIDQTVLCTTTNRINCYRQATTKQITVYLDSPVNERLDFSQADYLIETDEGFYPNKELGTIQAVFRNPGPDTRQVQHSFLSGNEDHVFGVEANSGRIFQVGELNFIEKPEYIINYGVFYGELSNNVTLTIRVKQKPCLKPYRFTATSAMPVYTKTLVEETASPSLVASLQQASGIQYTLKGEVESSFSLQRTTEVHITGPLDRDYPYGHSVWQVNVEAYCNLDTVPADATRTYAIVSVTLTDINDNSPVFDTNSVQCNVLENQVAGTTVCRVIAVDYDEGINAKVKYVIAAGEDGNQFEIGAEDGILKAKFEFDREAKDSYRLVVDATDEGPKGRGSVPVLHYIWVTIDDLNDHKPVFLGTKKYTATVPENQPVGSSVLTVFAEDLDIWNNARRIYSVTNENHFVMDSIYSTGTGVVKIKEMIDYDTMGDVKSLTFMVKVQGPAVDDTDEAEVTVSITDVNDNAPVVCDQSDTVCNPCTPIVNATVSEGQQDLLVTFVGCDSDSGINKEFTYFIDYQNTDPERNFQVKQTSSIAEVSLIRPLDREKLEVHEVHLLAIDKGVPALTGTGTLIVTVEDVNDNAPEFAAPGVMRVVRAATTVGAVVGEWNVIDRDSPQNGPPFTVNLDCQLPVNTLFCGNFSWTFDNTKVTVRTKFDRYERTATFKRFMATFTLKDSGGQQAERELWVEIEDTDNHQHRGSQKYTTVYSYEGLSTDMNLGHFYAADIDDWDRTIKNYKLVNPPSGFSINPSTPWNLRMGIGVDPTIHTVTVDIGDPNFATVRSYVEVQVEFLYEDAIHNSGSIRLRGLEANSHYASGFSEVTAQGFIERHGGQASKLDRLQEEVGRVVGGGTVQVFHVKEVEGQAGVLDIYYMVKLNTLPATYLRRTRLDGNVWLNKAQIETALGANTTILMAPIDECSETTCWDGTCHNQLIIDKTPVTVDANVTSLVGINVTRQASCQCDSLTIPPQPEVCTMTTCLNGGTCHETWANANCSCPEGFEGPRCQKLKRSFNGKGWAWFNPLYLCETDVIRFKFATSSASQQQILAYSGPMLSEDSPAHLVVRLMEDGYPDISVNMGSGPVTAKLAPSNSQPRIDDGQWHSIEIYKNGQVFRLVVDHCQNSLIEEQWNTTSEDRSPCQVSLTPPGEDLHVTFTTPLQLGGRRATERTRADGFGEVGLNGCIKDFFHSGEIYDLYIGEVGQAEGSVEDCPAETAAVYRPPAAYSSVAASALTLALSTTAANENCERGLNGGAPVCTCKAMTRGQNCTEGTTTRDFLTDNGFLEWKMNAGASDNRKEFLQLSFRSRNTEGILFFAESHTTLERCFLQIIEGHLTFTFDLGSGDKVLPLNNLNVSDGLWHTAYISRYGNQVTLTVDGGEGRYYNETEPTDDFRKLLLTGTLDGGAAATYRRFHTSPDVTSAMKNSYLTDVRFSATLLGDQPLAMMTSQNDDSAATLTSDNVNDVSIGPVPDPPCSARCPSSQICLDYWRLTFCGCLENQTVTGSGVCEDLTDCSVVRCGVAGICVPQEDLSGQCFYPPPVALNAKAGIAGSALGIIIGALLLMLLLLLLSTLVQSKKVVQPEFYDKDVEEHMRENIAPYEIEGAGEELPLKTDLKTLLMPVVGAYNRPEVVTEIHRNNAAPQMYSTTDNSYPHDVGDLILRHKVTADDDDDYPADYATQFEYEGSASLATSLSSLQSTSTGDMDYNYLSTCGPRFQKLADLYGRDDEESEGSDEGMAYPANVLRMDPGVNPAFAEEQETEEKSPLPQHDSLQSASTEPASAGLEYASFGTSNEHPREPSPQAPSPRPPFYGYEYSPTELLPPVSSYDAQPLEQQGPGAYSASGHDYDLSPREVDPYKEPVHAFDHPTYMTGSQVDAAQNTSPQSLDPYDYTRQASTGFRDHSPDDPFLTHPQRTYEDEAPRETSVSPTTADAWRLDDNRPSPNRVRFAGLENTEPSVSRPAVDYMSGGLINPGFDGGEEPGQPSSMDDSVFEHPLRPNRSMRGPAQGGSPDASDASSFTTLPARPPGGAVNDLSGHVNSGFRSDRHYADEGESSV